MPQRPAAVLQHLVCRRGDLGNTLQAADQHPCFPSISYVVNPLKNGHEIKERITNRPKNLLTINRPRHIHRRLLGYRSNTARAVSPPSFCLILPHIFVLWLGSDD